MVTQSLKTALGPILGPFSNPSTTLGNPSATLGSVLEVAYKSLHMSFLLHAKLPHTLFFPVSISEPNLQNPHALQLNLLPINHLLSLVHPISMVHIRPSFYIINIFNMFPLVHLLPLLLQLLGICQVKDLGCTGQIVRNSIFFTSFCQRLHFRAQTKT